MKPHVLRRLFGLLLGLAVLSGGLWFLFGRPRSTPDAHDTLRVMTYSSFMNAWGPGPEIAKRFRAETGIAIEFQDAGDAGLILQKLDLFPVDVVLGLDGFSLKPARSRLKWRDLPSRLSNSSAARDVENSGHQGFSQPPAAAPPFVAIDWAPIAFVYRKGEIDPPKSLRDLLDPRFRGAVAIEDPRTSTVGLQFLLWVLDSFGEEGGFKYLAELKPSLHSVSPSWSSAYGAFEKNQAKVVLSYMTSPIYNLLEKKPETLAAAPFEGGNPVQVDYAGIPADCARCADSEAFLAFLLTKETQSLIMSKNIMMPIVPAAVDGTPFATVLVQNTRVLKSAPEFLEKRDELFEKWRLLGL